MRINKNDVDGLLAIGVGLYSIFKGKMGIGPLRATPQFYVNGPAAIAIGLIAVGIGVFLLLSTK